MIPIPTILKDTAANEELSTQGFTILDYLNNEEVADLKAFFHQIVAEPPQHFFATTHSPDNEFRKAANRKIEAVLARAHAQHLQDGHPLGGAFISKPKGPKGILPLHQDWNIVDETQHRSFNIWIPLVNVREQNGAVFVLPGSHNKTLIYRGPNLPSAFQSIEAHVVEQMEVLEMKAGQALIYDHALLHTSPANQTDELRTAVVLGMVPRGTDLRFYYRENGQLAEYAGYPEYFFENDLQAGPGQLEKLRELPGNMSSFSATEFDRIFLDKKKNGFLRWFKRKRP